MALCALGVCLSQTGTQITQDDNTRKQPLSDASVKIDGSTSWRSAVDSVVFDWSQVCLNWLVLLVLVILRIWLANAKRSLWRWWRNIFAERLSGCAEFHMVRLIEPLSLHVLPKLGKTWLVLLVDVFFYFVFEVFLSCSKLQWCVVEFQELWWDRHHWWHPMKATTLKQTVWTWMVRLPDSLCKHQQESELLWHLFCDAVTLCFRCAASDRRDCTIPVCALREARTEWIQKWHWDS